MPQRLDKPLISIVDYGMGNISSIQKACEHFGFESMLVNSADKIFRSKFLVLPGVGAFGDAMRNLDKLGLIKPIIDFVKSGKPFLGICLGMQLLFEESEEFGRHAGLGIIKGKVKKFPAINENGEKIKIPNIGWRRIWESKNGTPWKDSPHEGLENGTFVYFVHSYYCDLRDEPLILSYSEYAGVRYCSSILKSNVYASQFHPEKSGQEGLRIYKNWLHSDFVLEKIK